MYFDLSGLGRPMNEMIRWGLSPLPSTIKKILILSSVLFFSSCTWIGRRAFFFWHKYISYLH